GKLISIKTTSGFFSGKSWTALSALPQSASKRKPEARLIQPARILRAWESSSTIATEMTMLPLYLIALELIVMCFDDELNPCAFTRGAVPRAVAADFFKAFAHISQTVATAQTNGIRGRGLGEVRLRAKAGSVIDDPENEAASLNFESDPHLGRAGVFEHVVQSLLQGKKDVVPDLRSHASRGQVNGDIQPATDSGAAEKLLRESAKISHQTVQGVVPGINRPNDFIHGAGQFASGA